MERAGAFYAKAPTHRLLVRLLTEFLGCSYTSLYFQTRCIRPGVSSDQMLTLADALPPPPAPALALLPDASADPLPLALHEALPPADVVPGDTS